MALIRVVLLLSHELVWMPHKQSKDFNDRLFSGAQGSKASCGERRTGKCATSGPSDVSPIEMAAGEEEELGDFEQCAEEGWGAKAERGSAQD
jgi:hypothetical protein